MAVFGTSQVERCETDCFSIFQAERSGDVAAQAAFVQQHHLPTVLSISRPMPHDRPRMKPRPPGLPRNLLAHPQREAG